MYKEISYIKYIDYKELLVSVSHNLNLCSSLEKDFKCKFNAIGSEILTCYMFTNVYIYKLSDDYYKVTTVCNRSSIVNYYLCDQYDGLIECLKSLKIE